MTDNSHPTWPRRFPVWRMTGLILSVVCGALFIRAWLIWAATPLERFYFSTFVRLAVFRDLPSMPKPGHKAESSKLFSVVFLDQTPATDATITAAPAHILIHHLALKPDRFAEWLQANIYNGRSTFELLHWPLGGFVLV